VGTSDSQSLSNKTLILASGSLKNITMFNQGPSGITSIVGDSTNPNANRLEIKDNEVALNTMVFVQSTGAIKSVKNASDTDGTYKHRVTDNDGTTDRFAVLAGGTLSVVPTSTTTFVGLDVVAPDTTVTKRAIRVAASGGGTERFTVFNDGHTTIVGQAAAQTVLKVTAAASPSVDVFNVSDSGANTLAAVQSTGKFLMNKGATIAQPGVTSGAVLQVGGSNVGYTGNLEQWVGPGNTIVAQINEIGSLSLSGVGQMLFAAKGADTTRSTATTSDDPDLTFSVSANSTYVVEGFFSWLTSDATNADINLDFTVPAGGTGLWSGIGQPVGATTTDGVVRTMTTVIDAARTYGANTDAGNPLGIFMRGILKTTTAGTYAAAWARTGASGSLTLQQFSFMRLVRVL